MARTRTLFQRQLPTVLIPLLAGIALAPKVAYGQIVPDETLGEESSTVRQDVVKDVDSDVIEGGATRGANLFHSFQEFNVEAGRGAYFDNPAAIDNILSRVTGSNSSSILGTLGVLGDANLFLINPNGIVFGENARLDVGGSFFASTADSLLFENGFEFSGSNPEAPPLLTVNIPVGLGFRDNPGSITNQSRTVDSNESPVGLEIKPGKNFTFAGGDITLDGGIITAPGGRVELGGLSAAGEVNFNDDNNLSFPENVERSDVLITDRAAVNVVADGGGDIVINARNLEILEESDLLAGIRAKGGFTDSQAGDIVLNASEDIQIKQGSYIENIVDFDAIGEGGSILITAGSLSVVADGRIRDTELTTDARGVGNAGQIKINTRDTISFEGFFAEASSTAFGGAVGNSGSINIQTGSLFLIGGGQLTTNNYGQGNAGEIKIVVRDSISLDGNLSEISSEAIGDKANGADININTGSLFVTNGARLTSRGFQANAGNINITAQNIVSLEGRGDDIFPGGILTSLGSEIAPQGEVVSIAGDINIDGGSLFISEGAQINSSTFQKGNAGNININVREVVHFDGESDDGSTSGAFSRVEEGSIGNAGDIEIKADSVFVTNGAELEAGTFGQGNAGDIKIVASDRVFLAGERSVRFANGISSTVAITAEGNGGDIEITADSLSVSKGAQIDAFTVGLGDAGDIKISASDSVSIDGENSGVFTSAGVFTPGASLPGNSGNINIFTNNLSVTNGAEIGASQRGQGNAGDIKVQAQNAILLQGVGIDGSASGIFSFLAEGATGDGGDLTLETSSLSLQDGAAIDSSNSGQGNAGNITINTNFLSLTNHAQLNSTTFGQGDAGTIKILAEEGEVKLVDGYIFNTVEAEAVGNGGTVIIDSGSLSLQNGAEIVTSTSGNGKAGNIEVDTTDSIVISGVAPSVLEDGSAGGFSSGLISGTEENAQGQGGEIKVNTDRLQISDGAVLSARSRSDFPGGNIEVNANVLEVTDGGQLLTTAFNNGNAGNIDLTVSDRISLSGSDPTFFDRFNQVAEAFDESEASAIIDPVSPESGLFANTDENSTGAGGKIKIDTSQLLVSDGAQISASTDGAGKGGELTIHARQGVELSGTGSEKFDEAIEESLRLRGANGDLRELLTTAPFSTATFSTGAAGTITIDTPSLLLRDGAILSSTTFGEGDAGGIAIFNAESVELFGSGLVAGTFNANAEAVGGNIDIDTGKLSLQEGGRILTTTFGNGKGGNVMVEATEFVELGSTPADVILPTTINTSSVFGMGGAGNVTIDSPKLMVRDGSQIVTSSGSDSLAKPIEQGGTGGNIEVIASESVEISGTSPDGRFKSALTAESFSGSAAGNIKISSDSLTLDNNSEISAATASGEGGNINWRSPISYS